MKRSVALLVLLHAGCVSYISIEGYLIKIQPECVAQCVRFNQTLMLLRVAVDRHAL